MTHTEGMTAGKTAGTLAGRAIGVLFFAGFGSIWLFDGLAAMHRIDGIGIAAILTIAAALIVPALRLLQTASKAAPAVPDLPDAIARKREFYRVNTIQWIAIAAAVVFFNLLHRPEFLAPVIAFIVGMHLFPLAKLFRYPAHNVTGILLVLWSTGIVALLADADLPSAGAIGAAVILLGSAAYTLIGAYREAKLVIVSGMKYSAAR
jgi:hypothetical protein